MVPCSAPLQFIIATMTEELPDDVKATLDAVDKNLSSIQAAISPLTQCSYETLSQSLAPLDRAKMNIGVAYAINALFYSSYPIFYSLLIT